MVLTLKTTAVVIPLIKHSFGRDGDVVFHGEVTWFTHDGMVPVGKCFQTAGQLFAHPTLFDDVEDEWVQVTLVNDELHLLRRARDTQTPDFKIPSVSGDANSMHFTTVDAVIELAMAIASARTCRSPKCVNGKHSLDLRRAVLVQMGALPQPLCGECFDHRSTSGESLELIVDGRSIPHHAPVASWA